MDKFVLKSEPAGKRSFKSALIDFDTHDRLKQLNEMTGISISKLIAECVKFCLERLEVEEE